MSPRLDSGSTGSSGSDVDSVEDTPTQPRKRRSDQLNEDAVTVDTGGLAQQEPATTTREPVESAVKQTATRREPSEAELRRATRRASQSMSLGTTGVGTTGTRRSRLRQRTRRASQGQSFSTTTVGTTQRPTSDRGESIPQASEIGGDATTYSDRELQRGEQTERVRESVVAQIEEQGGDPRRYNIDVERSGGQFQTDITRSDREQYGDIDWSMGLGDPNRDEVEQFVDETIGERGSELARKYVADPLREFGQDAKNADLFGAAAEEPATVRAMKGDYDPFATSTGENTPGDDSGVGPGQAVGNLALATANIAEQAPRFPGTVLEAYEGANYLFEGTPIAGGSEEEFEQRGNEALAFGAAVARQAAQRARRNPGTFAGEALVGFGAGKAISATRYGAAASRVFDTSAARRAAGRYTPDVRSRIRGDSDGAASATSSQSGLGTGGTGLLLDADAVDAARGVSGPSRINLARGRVRRAVGRGRSRLSETADRINVDTNRVGAGLVPPKVDVDSPDTPDVPDRADFSRNEILEGSPRDRMSSDVSQRTRRDVRESGGDFEGEGSPFRPDRGATFDPETREIRAGTDVGPATGRPALRDASSEGVSVVSAGTSGSGLITGTALSAGALGRKERAESVRVLESNVRPTAEEEDLTVPSIDVSGSSPFATLAERTERETDSKQRQNEDTAFGQRDRTRTDVDTETGVFTTTDEASRPGEDTAAGTDSGLASTTRPTTRPDTDTPTRTAQTPEPLTVPDSPFDLDSDQRVATQNDNDRRALFALRAQSTRFRDISFPDVRQQRQRERRRDVDSVGVPFGSDQLVPGWFEETATDIATRGFSGDISPSQEQLEDEPASGKAVGSLPTRQFFGDEETQEEIEAAQAFLSFGTVGEPDDDAESFFGGEL